MTVTVRTVAGVPSSVAEARGWVADVLRGRGHDAWLVETAMLVVSELVTNAVKYTDGPIRVELLTGVCRVRVSVTDAGTDRSEPTAPRSRPDPDNPDAARGLFLVDLWAERLAVQGNAQGHTVYADIAATRDAASHACA